MHVDIHAPGRHLDEEQHDRLAVTLQRRIGLAQGVGDDRRGGRPAVDEDILLAAIVARLGRQPGKPVDAQVAERALDRPQTRAEVGAEEIARALLQRGAGRQARQLAAIRRKAHANLGMRQGMQREDRADVRLFGLKGAQEFAAGRHVEEEVAHSERGADRHAGLAHIVQAAAHDHQLGAGIVRSAARFEREARDRGDGGQRLAAKAKRVDPLDIVHVADLAGRLPLNAEQGVVAAHAAAVVAHLNQLAAARGDGHIDPRGAGVDGVLHQLLHHRGRPFHHLAGRDLVRDMDRQQSDMSVFEHAHKNDGSAAGRQV